MFIPFSLFMCCKGLIIWIFDIGICNKPLCTDTTIYIETTDYKTPLGHNLVLKVTCLKQPLLSIPNSDRLKQVLLYLHN